jgi:hypothetical protein
MDTAFLLDGKPVSTEELTFFTGRRTVGAVAPAFDRK